MHDVSAGLFIYFARLASDVAAISPSMVLCVLVGFGANVGATPTAIMGALEPLTAVAIGVLVFGELFTFRLAVGIVLILSAVLLIVMGKSFHIRTITHTITTLVRKTWRWKS